MSEEIRDLVRAALALERAAVDAWEDWLTFGLRDRVSKRAFDTHMAALAARKETDHA